MMTWLKILPFVCTKK